MRKAKENMRK